MRNMAVLHSPAFSYPLPVLVRVLFNLLIFKGKILYYNKYNNNSPISKKEWARYMYVSSIVGDDYLRSTLKRVMKKLEQQLNGRNE